MLQVERLLADCLRDARTDPPDALPLPPDGDAYAAARRTFLAAGLRALCDERRPDSGWTQVNVAVEGPHAWPALYRRLADTARELTGSGAADDFFFLHKPPGLRVRFHAPEPAGAATLREELVQLLDRERDGWPAPVPVVYEPETYLFGGARSMESVHRLHTADTWAWLDHHTGTRPPADWRVSLILLRAVLDGLGIVGWEHRGVWQEVREGTGRRLAGGVRGADRERAAAGIRAYWEESDKVRLEALPTAWRERVTAHRDALRATAEQWRTDYFESGEARIGPRRAAAFWAVFHWNRGRFSVARQGLLTEALADDGRA
ncbi:thiopeptide-type bacteriocin biosynthesis protein [Streptomyces sp. TRM76323]|uniref:Thiopeptide-type bacteriocin biosynthesis protein n=1 Tax=Streptomyces tamarix TaxID=3078565 RepID=A0ABU3QNR8_9ACTN|nr:thiopeptide-type bacteriocin biosynthesis protein [Streptomyces tamarix]MDT9684393.1 thiopeptide-type bacteriocin biosynthesis protein [Streptomyces tamarix]